MALKLVRQGIIKNWVVAQERKAQNDSEIENKNQKRKKKNKKINLQAILYIMQP